MELHKNKELFSEIIDGAAEYFNFEPSHIEKDYWISKMLKEIAVSEYKEQAYFKGGTSLSKAYGIINRFSEDLDMLAYTGNVNASKTKEKSLNKNISNLIVENNKEMYHPEMSKTGGNFRKLYFEYDNIYEKSGLKQHLEVEIKACDFADKSLIYYPSEIKIISPIIGEYLMKIDKKEMVEEYGLEPFEIKCINPKKTICDKISRLVKLSYKENPIEEICKHIRDLYDLHSILSVKEYNDFLKSEDFLEAMYRTTVEDQLMKNTKTDLPLNNALIFKETKNILDTTEIKKAYNEELKKMLFHGTTLPSLEEIERTIAEIAKRIPIFETYRNKKIQKPITDITVIGQKTGNLQIRCKVDGIQQCAKPMTTDEIKEYDRMKKEGNEEDLKRFLENTAQKYFTGTQTKSQGLKR